MRLTSVIVDQREPDWVKQLTFGGAPVAVDLLPIGDVVALCDDGECLAIERKTASDLANTLRDDRLFGQVSRLREVTDWAYLVVTGTMQPGPNGTAYLEGRESGWNYASLTGALLDVQELGVRVLHVASDYDYEAAVLRLAKRDRGAVRVGAARQAVPLSSAERVLTAFDGIGLDRAQSLLRDCGTPAWCLQVLTDPQCRLPAGVGPETARRVRRTLGLHPEQSLYVLTHDRIELPVAREGAAA